MMPSSIHSVLWFSLLVLWASQSETEALTPDVCQDDTFEGDARINRQSTEQEPDEEWAVLTDAKNFPCYLHLTNIVNCSWSFPTLQKDTELFVFISVCDNEMEIESSKGRVGSKSFHLPEPKESLVILQFNISLHNNWAVYTYTYEISLHETEALTPDVCQDDTFEGDARINRQSTEQEPDEEWAVLTDAKNFPCYLHLTNIVNCSWSFPTLQKDTELFVFISVCDNEMEIESSKGRVGSKSFHLPEPKESLVILQFNISLHNNWAVYTYTYEISLHEALLPPANISASVKDGDLLVTWAVPPSEVHHDCFEYQLDLGDQETPKNIPSKLSYTERNADPSRTYRVRMRTRFLPVCEEDHPWSEWSQVVMIEPSNKLNILVIVSISLGIPMILLAVLLLVRYQRVSKVLFPPIPRPPPKYIHFLEKNDTFNTFLPAPSAEPMEEITEVEDSEEKP